MLLSFPVTSGRPQFALVSLAQTAASVSKFTLCAFQFGLFRFLCGWLLQIVASEFQVVATSAIEIQLDFFFSVALSLVPSFFIRLEIFLISFRSFFSFQSCIVFYVRPIQLFLAFLPVQLPFPPFCMSIKCSSALIVHSVCIGFLLGSFQVFLLY